LAIGVPGLTGNVKNFAFLGGRIGSDEMQLVAMDPRGRGGSETTGPGSYGWEHHARDVLGLAEVLGIDRFAIVGQSMGGSVAMKAAALDGARLRAVVLIDVAGRVDRGIGPVISASIDRLSSAFESADEYISVEAVTEDRAYTATQDPYERWRYLTMPTLLLRATRALREGAGYVVPVGDRDRFAREVARSTVVEVDANHVTINTHPAAAEAVRDFLAEGC